MGKLFGLLTLSRGIYEKWMMRRFLSAVFMLAGLVIITAVLIGATLVAIAYVSYITLIHVGMTPEQAGLIICAVLVLAIALFIWMMLWQINKLRQLPQTILKQKVPAISHANELIDAFVNGFMGVKAD